MRAQSGNAAEGGRTPPTAAGNFLLGNIRDIGRDPLEFLTTTARTHGDVVRFRLATYDFYLVTHPEGVQRILRSRRQVEEHSPDPRDLNAHRAICAAAKACGVAPLVSERRQPKEGASL